MDRMAAEIASFISEDSRNVRSKITLEAVNKGITVARAWKENPPKTSGEIEKFYRETDSYIYDLMVHGARQKRNILKNTIGCELAERNVDTVIDFGGGIGGDAIWLAKKGFKVTYYDLPGKTFDFAKWRFEKYGLFIETIDNPDKLKGQYDSVISIEVMEHVNHPVRILMTISDMLKNEGFFLMTESFGGVGEKYPSHLRKNAYFGRFFFEITMKALGFTSVYRKTIDGRITPVGDLYVFRKIGGHENFRLKLTALFAKKCLNHIVKKCLHNNRILYL